jgi:hypothetical protein
MKENKKKISYEDSFDRLLVFSPRTPSEARGLLDKLVNKGFKRDDTVGQGPLTLNGMCDKGVGVYNGRFFCAPDEKKINPPLGAVACAPEHLDDAYLSPDQLFMLDLFNKISERLDRIEKRLDDVQQEMGPHNVEKPALRTPKGLGGHKP